MTKNRGGTVSVRLHNTSEAGENYSERFTLEAVAHYLGVSLSEFLRRAAIGTANSIAAAHPDITPQEVYEDRWRAVGEALGIPASSGDQDPSSVEPPLVDSSDRVPPIEPPQA